MPCATDGRPLYTWYPPSLQVSFPCASVGVSYCFRRNRRPVSLAGLMGLCAFLSLLLPLVLCAILCYPGLMERCGTHTRNSAGQKWDRSQRERKKPVSLPESRPRRISRGNGDGEDEKSRLGLRSLLPSKGMRSSPVFQSSPLLELPIEVRDLIWEKTMGGRTLHLTSGQISAYQPRRLDWLFKSQKTVYCHGFVDCSPLVFQEMAQEHRQMSSAIIVDGSTWSGAECWHCSTCGHFFDDSDFGQWQRTVTTQKIEDSGEPGRNSNAEAGSLQRPRSLDGWNPLAVLRTCRMIYREALPHLYGGNTFLLQCEQQATDWPTTLLPSTRAQVTSIHLRARTPPERLQVDRSYDFSATLKGLARFEALKTLQIDCTSESQLYGSADSERFDDMLLVLGERADMNGGEVILRIPSSRNQAIRRGAKGLRVIVEPYSINP